MNAPITTPLTVAYIGNFRHPWCTEVHVAGSLRSLGHTVLQLQEDQLDWERLPDVAAGAHLVLWTRTWPADLNVVLPQLARLRDQRIPTVSYHLDRWWGLDREHQVADQPFFHTDLVVSPDGGNDHRWAEAGVTHLFLPPGVYAPECEPVPPSPRSWPHPVVFVGSLPYPHPEWHPYRQELVDRLRAHFGRRFAVYPIARGRQVRGRALQSLYATAKVVVGDSCLAGDASCYWSDRVPETLGRGGLLIHPLVEGMGDWYASATPGEGGDFLGYTVGDFDQVLALADAALADPAWARKVAEQGRATVVGRDTYAHRLAAVLDHVEEHLGFGRGPLAPPAPSEPPKPQPKLVRVRHRRHRNVHAEFELAEGDPDNVAIWEVWQEDTYQLQVEHVRGQVVVDVGANLGSFSVLAAKLGAARVEAYEPLPRIAAVAEANVARNGVSGRVRVHHAAVGAEAGVGWLADVAAGGAHLVNDCDGVEVAVVGINDLLDGLPAVGLLKVDCEGGEFGIIEAVTAGALAKVAHIAMEFHGPAMPHLTHLLGAPQWGAMVAKLAEHGRVRTLGHPSRGGLCWWDRY